MAQVENLNHDQHLGFVELFETLDDPYVFQSSLGWD